MRTRFLALLGSLAMAVALAGPLCAQSGESGLTVPPLTPAQEAEAHEAMTRLRSPVTAFHTVDMCPSSGALRDSIRVAAAGGATADRIVEDVVGRYGEQLRILPRKSGVGLAAWLGPVAVLLLGGVFVARRLRRERAVAVAFQVPAEPVSEEERELLRAAMREMEAVESVEP